MPSEFVASPKPPFSLRPIRWWILAAVLAAFAFGIGAPSGWRHFRERRAVAKAQRALEEKNYRAALLGARRVLERHPANVEANRIMAELAELVGANSAVRWRKQVLMLEPDRPQNRFDLAAAALRFGDLRAADTALQGLGDAERRTPAFYEFAAILAIRSGKPSLAARRYAEACRLAPSDDRLRFNRASAMLGAAQKKEVEEARRVFHEFEAHPIYRLPAKRALLNDAAGRGKRTDALARAEELFEDPHATSNDRLLVLNVLARFSPPALPDRLRAAQAAARSPVEFADLLGWMIEHDRAREAAAWTETWPPARRLEPPIPLAMANLYAKLGEWRVLSIYLSRQSWLSTDFLRLAFLARAQRELGHDAASLTHWKAAQQATIHNPVRQATLMRLAESWGWHAKTENLLWEMAEGDLTPRWALHRLFQHSRARGDTRGLRRVSERLLRLDPEDRVMRNNAAMFAMLLNGEDARAFATAEELAAAAPTNAAFVATQALALHLQRRDADAVRLLQTLDPQALETPSVAAYYGLVLAGSHSALARQYLVRAERARLLPEERALIDYARRQASLSPSPPKNGQPSRKTH